jgi:acylglycerol lipase
VAEYVGDVADMVTLAKSWRPGLPVFLLGHFAGGVIARLYTIEHQAELARLNCESFAHEIPAPEFALTVFKGLSHVASHAHRLRLRTRSSPATPRSTETMNKDPLSANETQPTQTLAEIVRADERLKQEFRLITLPVLILDGTADQATKPSGSKRFYAAAGSTDKTLKPYDGLFHDLLNDLDEEAVIGDINTWMAARLTWLSSFGAKQNQ